MIQYQVNIQNWKRALVGFMNRSLVRFEHEKSSLHTIVYGGTGTGKIFLIDNT